MSWLWYALALGGPMGGAAPDPIELVQAGRFRMAIMMYRDRLAADPEDHEARAGLAYAQGLFGRCDLALEAADAAWATEGWFAGAAAGQGQCALRMGDLSLAREAFIEAVTLDESLVIGWMGLARVAARTGDQQLLDDALMALELQGRVPLAGPMVRAEIAQQYGLSFDEELHAFDEALDAERSRTAAQLARAEVEAREWMRLDDPYRALEVIEREQPSRLTPPDFAALRGEVARRLGWTDLADMVFQAPKQSRSHEPVTLLRRARWHVDRAETDEARAILDETEGQSETEWLATRWYLARALGEDTASWEARWAEVALPGDGELVHLVPITER